MSQDRVEFDFPVSDSFARYEAWLNGETLPVLEPELPPLPERGAFNRAYQGNLSYPIISSTFRFDLEPPKKRPPPPPKRETGLKY